MPEVRKIQPSLAGGELSPTLYARVDLDKYRAGMATMRNFFVDVRGGASTRPGTEYCGFSATQPQPGDTIRANGNGPFATGAIMRPFLVGQGLNDSYEMELGQIDLTSDTGYIRFWQDGLPFLDPAVDLTITGITNASSAVVSATNTFVGGEWVLIAGVVGMPEANGWWRVVSPTGAHFEIASVPFFDSTTVDSTSWGTWTSGGSVHSFLTLTTPYLLGDVLNIKYAQSADVVVLTHPSYYPATVTLRSGTFTYADITVTPTQQPPTTLVVSDGGTTYPDYCWSYGVTSTSLDGKSESVMSNIGFRHYTIPDDTTGWEESLKWVPPSTASLFYTIYKCGPFDDRAAVGPGTIWGKIGQAQSNTFTDNNIPPDYNISPPITGDPFSGGQIQSIEINVAAGGAPSGGSWTGYLPLTFTGGGGSGAAGFATTDYTGEVTGVFLNNAGKNYSSFPTVSDSVTATTYKGTVSSITPTYPACAAFYQQRLLLGGANSQPDTMALSVPGDYFNFNTTPISQPTDAFPVDIAGTEVDTIQSLMPVSYGCLIFTTGGVWMMNGGGSSQDITPSTISFQAQAADGANFLQPLRINWSVLYNQFRGCVVRELAFAWQRQGYVGEDISAVSSHLFFGFSLLNWTWAEALWRNVLAVRNDGDILCLTYQPEQEVRGWSHWDTQGEFISISSIPEGEFNINYTTVLRHVQLDGATRCWVTYVERFNPRNWDCILDAWCLDCAVQVPFTYPDFPLFITAVNGDTVDFQLYDPCTDVVPGGSSPLVGTTQYIMEAKENFDPAHAVMIDTGQVNVSTTTPPYNMVTTDSPIIGMAHDYTRGKIMYLGFAVKSTGGSLATVLNDTGFALWDGTLLVAAGATYSTLTQLSPFVCQKDVLTGECDWFNTYDVNEIVPKGTGGVIIGEAVYDGVTIPNPPIVNTIYANGLTLGGLYLAIKLNGTTYIPSANVSQATYPYCDGSYTVFFRDLAGNSHTNVGTLGYTVLQKGGNPPVVTIVDFGLCPGGPVTYTETAIGDNLWEVDMFMPQGGTGETVSFVSWLLSDGTWRRIGRDFSTYPNDGNNPTVVSPYTNDVSVHALSCELYHYRYAPAVVHLPDGTVYQPKSFAQEISPYVYQDFSQDIINNPSVMVFGVDETWWYALVLAGAGAHPILAVVLIPANFQPAEIQQDKKLAFATYNTLAEVPCLNDYGTRGTFGIDGNIYFLSLYPDGDGEMNFRLTQFTPPPMAAYIPGGSVPGGTLKDVTPWTATTGPNLDGENYTFSTQYYPSWYAYFAWYRQPASGNMIGLLKFLKEQSSAPTDYTKTFFSCTYITTYSGIAYVHHSAFIKGYMTSAWVTASSIPATGYAVLDVREFDPWRDQTDFVYPAIPGGWDGDYSKRFFAFDCYPISGSTVGSNKITVIAQYHFVGTGVPVLLGTVIDETNTWDTAYAPYGDAIGEAAVVQNSLWQDDHAAGSGGNGAQAMNRDSGLAVVNNNQQYWWFSGQTKDETFPTSGNNMFLLDPSFAGRPQYNAPLNSNPFYADIAPPFLRLTRVTGSDQVIRAGCSLLDVTTINEDTFSGVATLTFGGFTVINDDPDGTILPFGVGDWSLATPESIVTGLGYLEDKEVWAFADGNPLGPFIVSGGTITLPFAASNIIVGLLYTCDLMSLRLEIEGQPTIQGRRKILPGVSVILNQALGLEVGMDFDHLFPMQSEFLTPPLLQPGFGPIPVPLFSGVVRAPTGGVWDIDGQVAVRQSLPLPATVLGLVFEATIGDDET